MFRSSASTARYLSRGFTQRRLASTKVWFKHSRRAKYSLRLQTVREVLEEVVPKKQLQLKQLVCRSPCLC